MNPSRIEKAIDDIIDFVESCKISKLSPNKVMVDRDELYDLLDALKACAPEEINRYKKIINNRDNIIREAEEQANVMLMNAQNQTAQILDQHELVQTAYAKANEIAEESTKEAEARVRQANIECEQIQKAAIVYTSNLLSDAEKIVKASLSEMNSKYTMLRSALESNLEVIRSNKAELMPDKAPAASGEVLPEENESEDNGNDAAE
ncbi:MAG: hypothetical protein J6I65_01235 [Lachnospiraceae bacterium]|nr:hypothetical protein [Lachnospiraceae bacterium]